MLTIGVAALLWIYLDPPGHDSFVQLAGSLVIAVATKPFVPAVKMLPPFVVGCLVAGALYIFVMPQLTGFAELGTMLFVVTFLIYFVYWRPPQALSRIGAVIPVLVLTSIQTEQTYSFSHYANTASMILLAICLIVATTYLPYSPRAEKMYLRLVARFFRHAELLVSRVSKDLRPEAGRLAHWRAVLYRADLLLIPHKLALWSRFIDYRVLPGTRAEDVKELNAALMALAWRITELVAARQRPQAAYLVQELLDDVRAWRIVLQDGLAELADDPGVLIGDERRHSLIQRLAHLEARVDEVFRTAPDGALDDADRANFYRLLGGFRGVSEAGLDFVDLADRIHWPALREARF